MNNTTHLEKESIIDIVEALASQKALNFIAWSDIAANEGDINGALQKISKAIELAPVESILYYKRAKLYQQLDNHCEAISDFDFSISHFNGFASVYYYRGISKLKSENYLGAIEDITQAIHSKINLNEAHYYLGVCYINSGQYEKAIETLEVYDKTEQNNKNYQLNLKRGQALFLNSNFLSAIEEIDKYLENYPRDEDALLIKAHCLVLLKRYLEAVEYYSLVVQINSENIEALFNRAKCYVEEVQSELAYEDLEKLITLNDQNPDYFLQRAKLKYIECDYAGVLTDCTTALKLNNDLTLAYWLRGWSRIELDYNAVGILADFKKIIETEHDLVALRDFYKIEKQLDNYNWYETIMNAYEILAEAKQSLGDWIGAENDYTELIKRAKENEEDEIGDLYYKRAIVRFNLHEWKLCEKDCSEAISEYYSCDESRFYVLRAKSRDMLGKYIDAIDDYVKAIELGDETGENYFDLAKIKEGVGDIDGAIEDYLIAAKLDNDYSYVKERVKKLRQIHFKF